jgi:hypothetical protein
VLVPKALLVEYMRGLVVVIRRTGDGRTVTFDLQHRERLGITRALLTGTNSPTTLCERFITRNPSWLFISRKKHRIFLSNRHRNPVFVNRRRIDNDRPVCVLGKEVSFCMDDRAEGFDRVRFMFDVEDDGGFTEGVEDE